MNKCMIKTFNSVGFGLAYCFLALPPWQYNVQHQYCKNNTDFTVVKRIITFSIHGKLLILVNVKDHLKIIQNYAISLVISKHNTKTVAVFMLIFHLGIWFWSYNNSSVLHVLENQYQDNNTKTSFTHHQYKQVHFSVQLRTRFKYILTIL